MTHLENGFFSQGPEKLLGPTQASDFRLIFLCDGILLLRYVERDDRIGKAMTVLKMKGCNHDKTVRELSIGEGGIEIGKVFGGIKHGE